MSRAEVRAEVSPQSKRNLTLERSRGGDDYLLLFAVTSRPRRVKLFVWHVVIACNLGHQVDEVRRLPQEYVQRINSRFGGAEKYSTATPNPLNRSRTRKPKITVEVTLPIAS